MKTSSLRKIVLLVLCAIALVGVALVGMVSCLHLARQLHARLGETKPVFLRDLSEAADLIRRGWIPDILPSSASNIYEKHNFEDGAVMVAFSFDPAEFTKWTALSNEVSPDRFEAVDTDWMPTPEPWFTNAIAKRQFGALYQGGFRLYEVKYRPEWRKKAVMTNYWVLVHPERGIAYLWN